METDTRQYKDVAGNPVTLDWLVKNEPEWAANQIRHRDKLENDNSKLRKALAELVGADGPKELNAMELALRLTPGINADKIAAVNAVHALRDTLTAKP